LLGRRLMRCGLLRLNTYAQAGKRHQGKSEGGKRLISHGFEGSHTFIPLDGRERGPLTRHALANRPRSAWSMEHRLRRTAGS
jgi:hypothetical protein